MKRIFYNARVYTGEEKLQQAFLTKDDVIAAVGSNQEILALQDAETEMKDMQGRFICPGFNDSHMHLMGFGESLNLAQLAPHTDSLRGMIAYLKEYVKDHPVRENQWLFGRGWNQDFFTDVERMPDRYDLDQVSVDYPILMTRVCGHACVVNSKALEIMGITADTPVPEGGSIGMEKGLPDGRFYDNAMLLLDPFMPVPDKETLKDMIRLACRELNAYGITSVQSDDYGTAASFEMANEAYQELEQSGELTVRVYEQANFSDVKTLSRFITEGHVTGEGTDMFRIGPLKMVADGSLGSRTAYLSCPYHDAPETRGLQMFTTSEMNKMISYAHAHGMQVAVHAIGDACLDMVLDAVEKALQEHPRKDHRHGIVHCQISRPDQLQRIHDLQMHVYAQSVFLDYDNHIVESRVGEEMARSSYSWKTLMNRGVSVSNGSDCPVELPDVTRGIECAVTRTSLDGTGPYLPGEAFTVKEALDNFTIRSAEASFEEGRKGKLQPGYLADFTVLSHNPFETDVKALHEIKAEETWLGGKQVY